MPRQLAGAPCPPARRPRLLAGCRERRRPRLAACSPAPPALPLLAQPRRRLSLVPPAPSRRSRRLLARAPAAPPPRACRPAPGAACGRPAPHPALAWLAEGQKPATPRTQVRSCGGASVERATLSFVARTLVCKKNRVLDYPSGFRYPQISVLGMNFDPNWSSGRVRVSSSGFGFGCPDIPSEPNPTRCHPYLSHHATKPTLATT